jgi:hypothetical protein
MSAASRLREQLASAGVRLALDGDGNLEWQAPADPPAALLAEARRLKPALIGLLRSEVTNENSGLLSLAEIAGMVEALAGALPLDAPDRLREAACLMRRAGHCRAEIAATLLPAVPLATLGMAARLALEDGLADAVGCEP